MNSFLVEGVKGTKRVVNLQPKESCSCPSTGQCYHILAVKQSLNIENNLPKRSTKNLTLLRKNAKPRIARKTGQKQPRKTDFEIVAAPDFLLVKCSTPSTENAPTLIFNFESKTTPTTPNITDSQSLKGSLKRKSNEISKAKKKIKFEDKNENLSTIVEYILNEEIDTSLNEEISNDIWLDQLRISDRDEIIDQSAWLNDRVINFAKKLIKSDLSINGMQDTLLAPHYDESKQEWVKINNFKKQEPPSCQIHYNGSNHWVASYQREKNGPVYLIDSLKSSKSLNANLSIQLSQIYNCELNNINVLIPDVQKQDNSSDCGVFAIAYITELALKSFDVDISNIRFITNSMREHLLGRFKGEKIEVFPKVKKDAENAMQTTKTT